MTAVPPDRESTYNLGESISLPMGVCAATIISF